MSQSDFELEFVREFQVHGLQLASNVSRLERFERVRLAIYRAQLAERPFRDLGISYAEAYRLWTGKHLDKRATPRPPPREEIANGTDDSADNWLDSGTGDGDDDQTAIETEGAADRGQAHEGAEARLAAVEENSGQQVSSGRGGESGTGSEETRR